MATGERLFHSSLGETTLQLRLARARFPQQNTKNKHYTISRERGRFLGAEACLFF